LVRGQVGTVMEDWDPGVHQAAQLAQLPHFLAAADFFEAVCGDSGGLGK
jgi:hypothetical protein